jgi:hypothetical protein
MGPFHTDQHRVGGVLRGGLFASYRRRSWPMVFFASVALLLKLWYIDRMTFYYVQNREREEPAEDAGVAPTSPSW